MSSKLTAQDRAAGVLHLLITLRIHIFISSLCLLIIRQLAHRLMHKVGLGLHSPIKLLNDRVRASHRMWTAIKYFDGLDSPYHPPSLRMLSILVYTALLGSVAATSPYAVPQAEWDVLNSTVGGRLARGVPFARACFEDAGVNVSSGGPDCASVQANYGSGGRCFTECSIANVILRRHCRFQGGPIRAYYEGTSWFTNNYANSN